MSTLRITVLYLLLLLGSVAAGSGLAYATLALETVLEPGVCTFEGCNRATV